MVFTHQAFIIYGRAQDRTKRAHTGATEVNLADMRSWRTICESQQFAFRIDQRSCQMESSKADSRKMASSKRPQARRHQL